MTEIKTAHNRRLAQWRMTWLIKHSTSHQLLWCIDSFVLRIPPLRQAPKRCGPFIMKSYLLILFLGLGTMSQGQSIENLQKRLSFLNNPATIKFDTTGLSKLPKLKFLCTSDIVVIEPNSTEKIVPSETKDSWRYFSVIDLNNDGLNDLIYSGPCNPYDETGIFINDGKNLQLVYDYPGAIISIEKYGSRTIINSLKEACCCDSDFDFTEIVINKGSSLVTTNRITYGQIPKTNFKNLEKIKIKGILRRTHKQDDADKKDQCSDRIIKGNHWLSVDKEADAIKLSQSGQWVQVLYKKNKDESIIGWIKSE